MAMEPAALRAMVRSEIDLSDREQFCDFLREQTCYDMLPVSYKVIIFDTALLVKKAFFALVQNEIRAAPLFDAAAQKIVGMLTVTDFVEMLRFYHHHPDEAKQLPALEEHKIQSWLDLGRKRREAQGKPERRLLSVSPDDSLYDAAKLLVTHRIHRLPLIMPSPDGGTESVVGIITQIKVLRYIATQFTLRPEVLRRPLAELGIGTFENLATARMDTPLIEVLDMFVTKNLSAVPIIDDRGVLIDVYEKYDVSYLARDNSYSRLDMPIREALGHRIEEIFEGVHTCTMSDTLSSLFDAMRTEIIHRLIVVDDRKHLRGIISVSDVLAFLLCV